jgi:predicted transcriptional regulator
MNTTIMGLTAKIVSAQLDNNALPTDQLSTLIRAVHQALATVGQGPVKPAKAEPAVPVKKSTFAGHLVCLECAKHFKTLKRHLTASHHLTADNYRSKFGLPDTYPMVTPDYAKVRSALAKKLGLGNGSRWIGHIKAGRERR